MGFVLRKFLKYTMVGDSTTSSILIILIILDMNAVSKNNSNLYFYYNMYINVNNYMILLKYFLRLIYTFELHISKTNKY